MQRDTGEVSAGNLSGNKLYQARARKALPILVRQAVAGSTLLYGALAEELGMPNPRNLNYVLGAIGNQMLDLGEAWGESVPPIQALVINKASGLPGEGISWFAPDASGFKTASPRERRRIVYAMLSEVFGYTRWDKVLAACGLTARPGPLTTVDPVSTAGGTRGGGGEGEAHLRLKEAVAAHPEWVGLPANTGPGRTEAPLRSGDSVDVLFSPPRARVAVEVKGVGAPEAEVARGMFQCVKYAAVLEAESSAEQVRVDCSAILALGDELPGTLRELRNTLGIDVFSNLARAKA